VRPEFNPAQFDFLKKFLRFDKPFLELQAERVSTLVNYLQNAFIKHF